MSKVRDELASKKEEEVKAQLHELREDRKVWRLLVGSIVTIEPDVWVDRPDPNSE